MSETINPTINERLKAGPKTPKDAVPATASLSGQTFLYIFVKQVGFLIATAAGLVVAIALSVAVRTSFFIMFLLKIQKE